MPTSEGGGGQGPRGRVGLLVIGVMKLAGGLLLAAAGFGLFRLFRGDVPTGLEHVVRRLHLDPENRLVQDFVARAAGLDRAHLKAIEGGTFFYAVLETIEGVGLILRKRWAEFLTVLATGLLLPLEIYEIARKPTALRFLVLGVNLAVLVYLLVKLKQQRKEGKAWRETDLEGRGRSRHPAGV